MTDTYLAWVVLQTLPVQLPDWVPIQQLAVVAAVVVSVAFVWWAERPNGRWGALLRRRLLAGVPWGTLVVGSFVLGVYLFVQGGLDNWYSPVVIPFRAWSYLYPLGILTAGFTHSSAGHLLGNLIATLVLAPIAEYAWGHFPTRRGASSFGSWRENPYVRAFVLFPGAVIAVGVLSSALAIGPVIGFSGVVFAFAGFALVRYPLTTVLALVASRVVALLRAALFDPTVTARAQPSFTSPWWADIAIQGHALGLLTGVLLGVWLFRRRAEPGPSAARIWTGVLLFAVSQSLWAVYWFRGSQEFVLFRAVGAVLVLALATLVALSATASDRPLLPGRARNTVTDGAAADGGASPGLASLPRWQWGVVLLVLSAAAISGPAVPINLVSTSDDPLPGDVVEVRDYEVTYAENVRDGMVAVVNVSAFGETTAVNTSGVIVRSADRGIWTTAVSKERLAFDGRTTVRLGGVGWRDHVVVERSGWTLVGGGAAYQVNLTHDGETRTAFRSESVTAEPVVAGRNVSIAPTAEGFVLEVRRDNESVRAPVPPVNGTVTLDGIRFDHVPQGRSSALVATFEETGTTLRIATRETYLGQREF